nr:Trp operon leader peptide [Vibrio tapetis]
MLPDFRQQHNDKVSVVSTVLSWWRIWSISWRALVSS